MSQATYEFACECGATKELRQRMSDDLPETLPCGVGGCEGRARRVWSPPAAVHFKGNGFYSTDVKGRQERKRRPNPGDDLHVGHDEAARRIARSL